MNKGFPGRTDCCRHTTQPSLVIFGLQEYKSIEQPTRRSLVDSRDKRIRYWSFFATSVVSLCSLNASCAADDKSLACLLFFHLTSFGTLLRPSAWSIYFAHPFLLIEPTRHNMRARTFIVFFYLQPVFYPISQAMSPPLKVCMQPGQCVPIQLKHQVQLACVGAPFCIPSLGVGPLYRPLTLLRRFGLRLCAFVILCCRCVYFFKSWAQQQPDGVAV